MVRTRGPAADTDDRLIAGTLSSLRRFGREGTSIASIARESGLSRPTIYAHGHSLEDLVNRAVEHAAIELSDRLMRAMGRPSSPEEALVEFLVAAHREFRADPVVALLVPGEDELPEDVLALVRTPMGRIVDAPADRVDVLSEAVLRTLLSLLTFGSVHTRDDDALRAYLRTTLVPVVQALMIDAR